MILLKAKFGAMKVLAIPGWWGRGGGAVALLFISFFFDFHQLHLRIMNQSSSLRVQLGRLTSNMAKIVFRELRTC
jgi:hypothetical protein